MQHPGYNNQMLPGQQGYMPPNGPAAMNIPPPAPGMGKIEFIYNFKVIVCYFY